MTADYKANPTSGGAMRLNRYARRLKGQNQAEFGGTGEAFTFGDKTYQPGDERYLEAINAAKSIMHGDNTSVNINKKDLSKGLNTKLSYEKSKGPTNVFVSKNVSSPVVQGGSGTSVLPIPLLNSGVETAQSLAQYELTTV